MKRGNLAILVGIALVLAVLLVANRHVFLPGQDRQSAQAPAVPVPAQFPADFPIYPGAAYTGAEESVGQVNGRWYDRGWFETRDDPAKVIAWYDSHLPEAGYPPVTTLDRGYSKLYGFAAEKGAIQLEVFIEQDKPTDFSVDFYSPAR